MKILHLVIHQSLNQLKKQHAPESSYETPSTEQPAEETTSYSQTETAAQSQIGIEQLMGKRFKLEEAIDYVGGMIKDLKEKRTNLVKNIEDESVDIKNLKEKLTKINQFIQEENQGLQDLTSKTIRSGKRCG